MALLRRKAAHRSASRRFLPEGRLSGAMPWVIAIMMFFTIVAAAAGIALDHAARSLSASLAGRITVQVVEADPVIREEQAGRVVAELRWLPGVTGVQPVSETQIEASLRPWLGEEMMDGTLPIPALIDVDLSGEVTVGRMLALRDRVRAIAPTARVEPHAAFLAPLASLLRTLEGLALAVVLLMALATGAIVVLAAQAAHNSHRTTIEVLHLMGATDVQIARLFQRRIALDALFGGLVAMLAAGAVLAALFLRIQAVESDLLGAATLPDYGWAVLVLLPVAGVLLAMFTARLTVLGALRRSL